MLHVQLTDTMAGVPIWPVKEFPDQTICLFHRQAENLFRELKNTGLGGFSDSAASSDNWDNITKTGIYSSAATTQPELPSTIAGLVVLHIQASGYATQLCMRPINYSRKCGEGRKTAQILGVIGFQFYWRENSGWGQL